MTVGGWLSDVTPVDARTQLTITWLNTDGERHSIIESIGLADLMKELTP